MSTSTTLLGLVKPAAGEQFSRATYNNNLDTIDNYCINNVEKRSKGIIVAPKKQTANGVGITTLAVIENIASVTLKANRTYRVIWNGGFSTSVNGDYFDLKIQTCSTADAANAITGLTQIASKSYTANAAGSGESFAVEAIIEQGGGDSTLQLKATVNRTVGTGTWTLNAGATGPMWFYIEDLGDQY